MLKLNIDVFIFQKSGLKVSVWSPPSDAFGDGLIVSTIVSGHLEVLYGGEKGSEEAVLVG